MIVLRSCSRGSAWASRACLLVLMLAPVVTVVGYETLGHRHVTEALARMRPGRA